MKLKSSWKDKVDPEFDKFIKGFLELINEIGIRANDGYIKIEKDILNKFKKEKYPPFINFYDMDELLNVFKNDNKLLKGAINTQLLEKTEEIINNKQFGEKIDKLMQKITEPFEKKVKNYYLHWEYIPDPEKDLKKYLHFASDLMSINYHLSSYSCIEDVDVKHLSAGQCQGIFFLTMDIASLLIHKKRLKDIYEEAEKGDDDSLFKLIQIDKTAFDSEWVRERIRRALYEGDKQFFVLLGQVVKKDPLSNRKLKIEQHLVLMQFWWYGLYRLTVPEIMQLLVDSGMKVEEDEVTFRKFVDREIRPYFKRI